MNEFQLTKAKELRGRLWDTACIWEGISCDSKFVIFSDDNLHAKAYNRLNVYLSHIQYFV